MPALFMEVNMFILGFVIGYFCGVGVILGYMFLFGGGKK